MKQAWMLGAALLVSGCCWAQDVEVRAMKDELARTMKELKLADSEKPYYVAYKIVDTERKEAQASFGGLTASTEGRTRVLSVTVRVGSYALDNSNFVSSSLGLGEVVGELLGGSAAVTVDDNYEEIRRQLWLATDQAYKRAVQDLSAKQAALKATNREETLPDWSEEPGRQETELLPAVEVKRADEEHLVRVASAVFATLPDVETSSATVDVLNVTEHYVNSEGTEYMRRVPEVVFRASATLQRGDGETLSDSLAEYGREWKELPPEPVLVLETKQMVERLTAERKAKNGKRYDGPMLFEGVAAPQMFANHFAGQLTAKPRSVAGGGSQFSALLSGSTASLLNKVGARVLPEYLTVADNPQMTSADGHTLFGSYKFDEEGVPSRETVVVKDGVLKTLLTGRQPVRGMAHSTGNMRARGVSPGNLLVTATKSESAAELRKQMIGLLAARGLEFGIVVRRLAGNVIVDGARLYPDGHEEPIRNARLAEVTVASFKEIAAVGDERSVYTAGETGGGLLGSVVANTDLVSYVVPALLFEDMGMEHAAGTTAKPPVVPGPLVATKSGNQ